MTPLEKRAVAALCSVMMPEKNWHARRAELLNAHMVIVPERPLDIGEQADLWFLVWRYRRQVEDCELVRHANELVNGAMSLGFS